MPEATEILDAARGERLEAAHDLRDTVVPFGLIGQDDNSVHVVGNDNERVHINAMVILGKSSHVCCTIMPISFSCTSQSMTLPKSMPRFCVQTVMKQAPS